MKMTRVFRFIPIVRCLEYTLENCYQSSIPLFIFLMFFAFALSCMIFLKVGTVLYILNQFWKIVIMIFAYPIGIFSIFDAQLYKFRSNTLNAMIIFIFIIYKLIILRYFMVSIMWAHNRAREHLNRESLNEFSIALYIRERIFRRNIALDADRLLPKKRRTCSCFK